MPLRIMPPLSLGVMLLTMTGSAIAHHSFAGVFDGSRALHLHGVVASVQITNPHSYIYLQVRTADGHVETWALEGPSALSIRRSFDLQPVKAGDTLGVCGYAARLDASNGRTTPVVEGARRLSAAVLTLPNGEKRLWENYRQGNCVLDQ